MTQKEKDLLLKDLCTRLPHGVICSFYDDTSNRSLNGKLIRMSVTRFDGWNFDTIGVTGESSDKTKFVWSLDGVKPYLRPISSISEEEREDYKTHMKRGQIDNVHFYYATHESYDWLNAHHFDYRGLIPMGLALEAPEDMYKTESL